MTKDIFKSALPYTGLPVVVTALLITHIGRTDAFILLFLGAIVIFGYVAAIYDAKTKRIPNRLVLAMLAAWVIIITPMLFLDTITAMASLVNSALGFAVSGGLFLLVYFISRKGLGGGDVKFMAVSGLYLGFDRALAAMLCGTVLAALSGLTLILLKKIARKDTIPLAPFLYIGMLIALYPGIRG